MIRSDARLNNTNMCRRTPRRKTCLVPAEIKRRSLMETDGKTFLRFTVSGGYTYLEEIQLEGKKRMKTSDFLRGNKIL